MISDNRCFHLGRGGSFPHGCPERRALEETDSISTVTEGDAGSWSLILDLGYQPHAETRKLRRSPMMFRGRRKQVDDEASGSKELDSGDVHLPLRDRA